MVKKLVLSAKREHDVIKKVIRKLKVVPEIELILHDPTEDFLDLVDMQTQFGDVDFIITKVASDCSIDLLHFAKLYNIPTLHDVDTVLLCKNKVALDQAIRKIFDTHSDDLEDFLLPRSWTQSLQNINRFKEWALPQLPIVIKSHYQHDKYNRFNFLVQEINEIDKFCKIYSNFLYYNMYIQEFIESDGIERKVYVVGDKVFGIKRENPIYIFLRDKPNSIDVETIGRQNFEVTIDMQNLAKILAKELNLKIFGFDLVKPLNQHKYYLIDLNDFPGFMGIKDIDNVLADFLITYVNP
ncbi:MAG: hypothetical protein EU529_12535 [Promethearchaeota archaeon]|nr:MAG: hypothetical protein EU529_12535 [Candidatus Lokiarchaeota archaeon]